MLKYISPANLLTYLGILSSLLVFYYASQGHAPAVGLFLALASLFDLFDGKFASLFMRNEDEKKFGAQLDSLVDMASFGVIPLMALAQNFPMTPWWIFVSTLYLIATATRLAYFNIFDQEEHAKFTGLPTTLIGLF